MALVIFALILLGTAPGLTAQAPVPIDINDLADYRLAEPVLTQFVDASRRIVAITSVERRFTYAPLFTKEVALSGDAPAMANGLMARLENDPALSAALQAAKLTPREFSKFALTLVAAHLAHEFIAAGVLKRVPGGAPAQNVEFVDAHRADVTAVLETLGIEN